MYFVLPFPARSKLAAMDKVYATITLINAGDQGAVRRQLIEPAAVRSVQVRVMVHPGSTHLCINERVCRELGLFILEQRKFQLANGQVHEYEIAGPIEIRFKNRRFLTEAVVLPGENEMLLGAIPMEGMDVLVHPARHELVVNPEHPYVAQMKLKGIHPHR